MGWRKNSETRTRRTGAFVSLLIDNSCTFTRTDDFRPSTAARSDSISVRLALPSAVPFATVSLSSSEPTRPESCDNIDGAIAGFVTSTLAENPHAIIVVGCDDDPARSRDLASRQQVLADLSEF